MDTQGTQFNKYYQPVGSPIDTAGSFIRAMDYDIYNDRNSVGATKLRNFNFNAGTGGTIVLGGVSNQNGMLKIRDSAGSVIVQGDNNGLTITNGSITINNSSGSVVLDQSGIVSNSNFTNNSIVDNTTRTTTGTSYVDLGGSSLPTFILNRNAKAIVFVFIFGGNDSFVLDGSSINVRINDNLNPNILEFKQGEDWRLTGISQAVDKTITGWSTSTFFRNESNAAIVDLSAGTHTMNLQFKVNGSGTAEIDLYQFGYVLLGS